MFCWSVDLDWPDPPTTVFPPPLSASAYPALLLALGITHCFEAGDRPTCEGPPRATHSSERAIVTRGILAGPRPIPQPTSIVQDQRLHAEALTNL